MLEYNIIYSIISIISAMLVFTLGFISLIVYKSAHYARPLGLLMFCAAIYAFGYAFEILRVDIGWITLWTKVQYLGLSFLPACFIWLAIVYTKNERILKKWFFFLIFGISLFFLIAVYTNEYHHLYYTYLEIDYEGLFPTSKTGKGVLYLIQALWLFVTFILSTTLYIIHYFKSTLYKTETFIMIIAALGIILNYIFYIFKIIPFNFDSGPIAIAFDGCIFTYAMFKTRMLDISPIARDKIFENIKDVIIVTDSNNRIVDFNPKAKVLLSVIKEDFLGKNILKIIPLLKVHSNSNITDKNPLKITEDYYEVSKVRILVNRNKKIGTMWILRQITLQHQLMERLTYFAERDSLTEIWNRRKWIEFAKLDLELTQKNLGTIGIMIIDVDHFKSVNDTYGHDAGDSVLIEITKRITSVLSEKDTFGRLGGEEFAIVFPETKTEQIEILANEIINVISDKKMSINNKEISVSISGGIIICEKGFVTTLEQCMHIADKALYEAKNNGKNQVYIVKYNDVR